ncbi:hypothetical protein CEE37_11980 [candidate division LCP-89 bacterium B3_LCP]|uniref:Polysulfide reductase n=1 Tax=candidate division LCP-89 bacterium B3_LCP TaxID=2012998 RepID=A0A532UW33_UNCL8|nr:MAG: hypothetical protein CEE37_11980 [candidate division LCP-89 bacterium B3_LCP]
MIEVTNYRDNPLIDPHLEIWEWQISVYLFLGGLVAGLMILNGLWRIRDREHETKAITNSAVLWAPVLISLGMFCLWLDLVNKLNVYRFYMTFQIKSPMSWGSWILFLVYPAQILAVAVAKGSDVFGGVLKGLNPLLQILKSITNGREKQIAWLNVVLGVMLGIYTGILLSATAARPLWNTALLGPLFLVSGLSTATAWNMLSRPTKIEHSSLAKWDFSLIITEMFLLLLILIGFLSGTEGHQSAGMLLLGGGFTAVFWIFVIILGLLFPLWLELREMRGHSTPAWVAPALVLLGGLALRFVMVQAGQVSHLPDTELLFGAVGH